jgi:predicted flap endonuclease-1-like 5' DNA nuclease
MLRCSIAPPIGNLSMPATKTLPQFPAFGSYVDPFRTTETALSIWTEYWRAGASAMFWWTERMLQAPMGFLAWAPTRPYTPPRGPGAAVIDLAQAAAARVAADVSDVAAANVEILETVAEVPVSIAEDVASVATAAAKTLKPQPDDLTRMMGIGPKLAAALAERGVTTFAQIAAWTDRELVDFDKALDLKGRATRDAWVAQARRFAAES